MSAALHTCCCLPLRSQGAVECTTSKTVSPGGKIGIKLSIAGSQRTVSGEAVAPTTVKIAVTFSGMVYPSSASNNTVSFALKAAVRSKTKFTAGSNELSISGASTDIADGGAPFISFEPTIGCGSASAAVVTVLADSSSGESGFKEQSSTYSFTVTGEPASCVWDPQVGYKASTDTTSAGMVAPVLLCLVSAVVALLF